MILKFILRALIAAAGLWLAAWLVPGVAYDTVVTLLIAAVLLGIVNALVRPVVFVLTLPITIVTLGLFALVVNGMMVGLVDWLLKGFATPGLMTDILVAIVVAVVGWLANLVFGSRRPPESR